MKETILPVLPPILLKAPDADELSRDKVEPAWDTAEPAELWTRVRPSDALDTAFCPVSCAFEAASEVVEACRILFRRSRSRNCRRTTREAGAADMAAKAPEGCVVLREVLIS